MLGVANSGSYVGLQNKYVTRLDAGSRVECSQNMVVVAFSLHATIWGECSTIQSPPALIFFFKVEISLRTLIPLLRPGSVHSGSASLDDCDGVFPDELRVSSFPDRFSDNAWTAA